MSRINTGTSITQSMFGAIPADGCLSLIEILPQWMGTTHQRDQPPSQCKMVTLDNCSKLYISSSGFLRTMYLKNTKGNIASWLRQYICLYCLFSSCYGQLYPELFHFPFLHTIILSNISEIKHPFFHFSFSWRSIEYDRT